VVRGRRLGVEDVGGDHCSPRRLSAGHVRESPVPAAAGDLPVPRWPVTFPFLESRGTTSQGAGAVEEERHRGRGGTVGGATAAAAAGRRQNRNETLDTANWAGRICMCCELGQD
jgi:hypothetical protein